MKDSFCILKTHHSSLSTLIDRIKFTNSIVLTVLLLCSVVTTSFAKTSTVPVQQDKVELSKTVLLSHALITEVHVEPKEIKIRVFEGENLSFINSRTAFIEGGEARPDSVDQASRTRIEELETELAERQTLRARARTRSLAAASAISAIQETPIDKIFLNCSSSQKLACSVYEVIFPKNSSDLLNLVLHALSHRQFVQLTLEDKAGKWILQSASLALGKRMNEQELKKMLPHSSKE